MLPDYIIYDELKRQRERERVQQERPQLEVPRYMPLWPEDYREEQTDEADDSVERGEVVIPMW